MVGPIIDEVSNDYDGKAVVGKLDVDANQEYAAKYGVRNIPTVLVFKDGEIVNRQVGVSPQESLYGCDRRGVVVSRVYRIKRFGNCRTFFFGMCPFR